MPTLRTLFDIASRVPWWLSLGILMAVIYPLYVQDRPPRYPTHNTFHTSTCLHTAELVDLKRQVAPNENPAAWFLKFKMRRGFTVCENLMGEPLRHVTL